MIHGGTASIGCLAMGDRAIEELFVLAADVGIKNVDVVIAPCDLRVIDRLSLRSHLAWVKDLYEEIETALQEFPSSQTRNVRRP